MIGYGNTGSYIPKNCPKMPVMSGHFIFSPFYTPVSRRSVLCDWVWWRAGVHTGFRTITLVLYIGSLPNLATSFPCGRWRTLFIYYWWSNADCFIYNKLKRSNILFLPPYYSETLGRFKYDVSGLCNLRTIGRWGR
jgi:hypothetical protein